MAEMQARSTAHARKRVTGLARGRAKTTPSGVRMVSVLAREGFIRRIHVWGFCCSGFPQEHA